MSTTQVLGWKINIVSAADKPTLVTNVNNFINSLYTNPSSSGTGLAAGSSPVIHAFIVDGSAYACQIDYLTFITITTS